MRKLVGFAWSAAALGAGVGVGLIAGILAGALAGVGIALAFRIL